MVWYGEGGRCSKGILHSTRNDMTVSFNFLSNGEKERLKQERETKHQGLRQGVGGLIPFELLCFWRFLNEEIITL